MQDFIASIDWVYVLACASTIAYIITRALPELPPELTKKIPDVVMLMLNWLASKHKAEKAAKTDLKGNPVE